MSLALAQHQQQPAVWLDLAAASARSGLSVGQLRRLCATRYVAAGLARLVAGERGRQAWQVREDADARFADSPHRVEQIDASWQELTDAQRGTAIERRRILDGWDVAVAEGFQRGWDRRKATDVYLTSIAGKGQQIGQATLYRWRAQYASKGLCGLLDSRSKRDATPVAADDPFIDFLKTVWLTQRRPPLTVAHLLACHEAAKRGWREHSYSACRRAIAAIPAAVVALKRRGQKALDAHSPTISRDYSTVASNEIWCSDHMQFDVIVVGPDGVLVRPWLTSWQDIRSRKIVGWCIRGQAGDVDSIVAAFRMGAETHGLPGRAYVDNGKDYDSRQLQGVSKVQRRRGEQASRQRVEGAFRILGIDTQHCWEYHGQSKPIERFHGTVHSRFGCTFDTYTGPTTAEKPDDLARLCRLGHAPTLDEFRQAFAEWLEADYHLREHGGDSMDGMTPETAWEHHLQVKRVVPSETLAFACMERVGPRRVKQGVTWNGMSYGRFDPAVQKLTGQKVMLAIDPDDVSRVFVCSEDGATLICAAAADRRMGWDASKADVKAAIADKRKHAKAVRAYHQSRPRLSIDMTQRVIAAARERAQKTLATQPAPPADPPAIRPAAVPFGDTFGAIKAAMHDDGRKGSGGVDLDDYRIRSFEFTAPEQSEPDSVFGDLAAAMAANREAS